MERRHVEDLGKMGAIERVGGIIGLCSALAMESLKEN